VIGHTEQDSYYPVGYLTRRALPMSKASLYLSERCCITTGGNWYVKLNTGTWSRVNDDKVAALSLKQNWMGGPVKITQEDISKFMRDPPAVRGVMVVPTSQATCVGFNGELYINTYRNTFLAAYPEALSDPELRPGLELLLRVIRENLCGRPNKLSLEAMIDAAKGKDDAEMEWRFTTSWLAAPLQRPGRNLQTNLWWLGQIGGQGKGLMANTVLPRLYGPRNVAILNQEEVERGGWTDTLEGKLLVIANELDIRSKKSGAFWNTFINRNSTDDTITIRKRNTHGHDALNFANWLVTSNNTCPQGLNAQDRRNALIAVMADESRKPQATALATELYWWMKNHDASGALDRMLGGLMHILLSHTVDQNLVDSAPDTLLRRDVLQASSNDGDGLYWLIHSNRYKRDAWLSASDYLDDYNRFLPVSDQITARAFGTVLSGLHSAGHIERDQLGTGQRSLYRISSEKFPTDFSKQHRGNAGPKPPLSVGS
jgi:hypothetical protein